MPQTYYSSPDDPFNPDDPYKYADFTYPDSPTDPNSGLIDDFSVPQIPEASVPQPGMPPELQQMMGGQGYSPEVLAMMRAGVIEDSSNAGLPAMGQLNRGLSSAGLYGSPGASAMRANLGNQVGQMQAGGLRDVAISNAGVGNENKKFGLNLAHSYAMENANRLFEAMNQNMQARYGSRSQAMNLAFNQQPAMPGSGTPQQSAIGEALTGAAAAIQPKPPDQKPMSFDPAAQAQSWGPTDTPTKVKQSEWSY